MLIYFSVQAWRQLCAPPHTQKKNYKGSHFGRTCTWKCLKFCIEEGLLCFLKRSCFSSTSRSVCMLCFACYINTNLMGTWGQHCHLVTWTKHFSILLSQFHTHSQRAQKTDLAWQNCKTPLHNNAILYWLKAQSGWSPLNKGKNGESKMTSIPVPRAMNSSAIGCTRITTNLILDPLSCF